MAYACLLGCIASGPALAGECPNPRALGTSRTIVVDPTEHTRLGGFQYRETLPLAEKEVVLTFDDGPLPPHTNRILEILARECVKATFFMVGRMARAFPDMVRRVYAEGHTLASHSQNHLYTFHQMSNLEAAHEIESGFNSIVAAVGDRSKVAPFFRFPGLQRQDAVERYLKSRGIMSWSVDVVADDWTPIDSSEIVRRAVRRLEVNGKGILLLHDIKPLTAAGLQDLLNQLKARGFRIVHVVPATATRPKTATTADEWLVQHPPNESRLAQRAPSIWPRAVSYKVRQPRLDLEAPSPTSFGAGTPEALVPVELVPAGTFPPQEKSRKIQLASVTWPNQVTVAAALEPEVVLPVPDADNFRYTAKKQIRKKRETPRVAKAPTQAAPQPESRSLFSVLFGGGSEQPKAKSEKKAAPKKHTNGQPAPRPTASLWPSG
jgi:peptidoglycan/xylan/chitin deacetylase (PgdA/CDA1 family)